MEKGIGGDNSSIENGCIWMHIGLLVDEKDRAKILGTETYFLIGKGYKFWLAPWSET